LLDPEVRHPFYQTLHDRANNAADHEDIDAQSFADWGADSLKYDNCYMENDKEMDGTGPEYRNPSYFQRMATSLDKVGRNIQYFVCQWGNGDDLGHWYVAAFSISILQYLTKPRASKVANTYRISSDIKKDWVSIWRIVNQVIPYHTDAQPGAYPDMDMLM
jgi:alpha-galactosidase